jgi:hypothetical protein
MGSSIVIDPRMTSALCVADYAAQVPVQEGRSRTKASAMPFLPHPRHFGAGMARSH